MDADGATHKFLDFNALEAGPANEFGNGLRGIKCLYGVGEILIGAAVMRESRADPWNQPVKVKGVDEGKRKAGRGKHVQGDESPAGPKQAIGLTEKKIEVRDVAQNKGRHDCIEDLVFKGRGQRAPENEGCPTAVRKASFFLLRQLKHPERKIQSDNRSILYLSGCREGEIAGAATEVQNDGISPP